MTLEQELEYILTELPFHIQCFFVEAALHGNLGLAKEVRGSIATLKWLKNNSKYFEDAWQHAPTTPEGVWLKKIVQTAERKWMTN